MCPCITCRSTPLPPASEAWRNLTIHRRRATTCAIVQTVYCDARGTLCAFCTRCGRLCNRDVYFKPGNTAVCRVCSYMQSVTEGHVPQEDPIHTDIVALIPRAPADEPEMPQGQFPEAQGWVDKGKHHETCAVAGCDEMVPISGKSGLCRHKSRVCKTHLRASRVWEVRRTSLQAKRWCYKCSGWKDVDMFPGQTRMCDKCRASETRRKQSANSQSQPQAPAKKRAKQCPAPHGDTGVLLYGCRNATAHSEWLLCRSHAGPVDECRVLGCTAPRAHAKANVCAEHVERTLFRECSKTEEPLVRYCKGCRVFKPATGYQPDGRCSDVCANRGDLGMRAQQTGCAAAEQVWRKVQQQTRELPQDAVAVAKELGIGVFDDTRLHGNTCRHMTAAGDTCGRSYKGHVSQMCPSHIPVVVVRLTDRSIRWYCSSCHSMSDVTRMLDGRCATCEERATAHVRALEAYKAAVTSQCGSAGVPHDSGEGVGGLAVPRADVGLTAGSAPPRQVDEEGPGACRDDDGSSSTADEDDLGWGDLVLHPCAAQAAVEGGIAAPEAATLAPGDGSDADALSCRGGCNAPLCQGRALGGYCVVCMATVMRHACVLDLAVLATFPRCLVGGAGVLSVSVCHHGVPRACSHTAAHGTWREFDSLVVQGLVVSKNASERPDPTLAGTGIGAGRFCGFGLPSPPRQMFGCRSDSRAAGYALAGARLGGDQAEQHPADGQHGDEGVPEADRVQAAVRGEEAARDWQAARTRRLGPAAQQFGPSPSRSGAGPIRGL